VRAWRSTAPKGGAPALKTTQSLPPSSRRIKSSSLSGATTSVARGRGYFDHRLARLEVPDDTRIFGAALVEQRDLGSGKEPHHVAHVMEFRTGDRCDRAFDRRR
jgi:hypothetical protein